MELDFNALRELLAAIDQTDVAEFTLKSGDFELIVRKGAQTGAVMPPHLPAPAYEGATAPSMMPVLPSAPLPPMPSPIPSAPPAMASRANERLVDVTSPMVGTFYRAPSPDEAAYVNVGDRIRTGQVVCIVEAMKLMNEIESDAAGEIVKILVKDGQPVEYGQPLFAIR